MSTMATMASIDQSPRATMPTPQKEPYFSIQSLLSPPESKRTDTFKTLASPVSIAMSRTPSASLPSVNSSMQPAATTIAKMVDKSPRAVLMSPPISPQTPRKQEMEREEMEGMKDPPMFPRADLSFSNTALFPENAHADRKESTHVVNEHIAKRAAGARNDLPTAAEYQLVAESLSRIKFTPCVYEVYAKDPVKWYVRERKLEEYYRTVGRSKDDKKKPAQKRMNPVPSYPKLAPLPSGIKKASRVHSTPRAKAPRIRQAPTQKMHEELSNFSFSSPLLAKAPKTPTSRDDMDFMSIEDYCPPLSTLPNNSKALKADWKGQMLDLSNDPDRYRLHEAEVHLAATLRLNCATYLCSKRRVFKARVEAYGKNKDFRKTDAQQACKIDVNKASKLWTAFEKVGWFNDQHFAQHFVTRH